MSDDQTTVHDLVVAFEAARKEAEPGDEFAGNPDRWPIVRGIKAVATMAIASERERCLKIIDGYGGADFREIEDAIRAGQ